MLARRLCLLLVAGAGLIHSGSADAQHSPPARSELSAASFAATNQLAASGQKSIWSPPDKQRADDPFPWLRGIHRAAFEHTDPDDPARHVGLGHPLVGTSWRNRPWHIGWLVGGILGDRMIPDRIDQHDALLGGYRLGWDFNHYWGSELRFAFANVGLVALDPTGVGMGTSRDHFWDAQLLYYPWGDASWRPFFAVGMGWGHFRFVDEHFRAVNETVFTVPYGIGIKYLWDKWLAVRFELLDNWSLSSSTLESMHNLTLTAGVEIRLDGRRRSYFPHHPGGFLK